MTITNLQDPATLSVGSVSHEGIFDLQTGEFLRQTTQQGWRDSSSWARGLAWVAATDSPPCTP